MSGEVGKLFAARAKTESASGVRCPCGKRAIPGFSSLAMRAEVRRACKWRSPLGVTLGASSKHVQHAVAEFLGGFQSIAEIQ